MSVSAFYPNRGEYSASQTISAAQWAMFICDRQSELPPTANDGDQAYTKDSDIAWTRINGAWVDNQTKVVTTAAAGDPVSLRQDFRKLLRAWVMQGFPVPPGLESEALIAMN